MSTFKDDAAFLDWMAERLVNVYGESPNVDFVHTLHRIANNQRSLSEMESNLSQAAKNLSSFVEDFGKKCRG